VLVVGAFVSQPDWLARFFARSGERTRAGVSSSLWGLMTFLPSTLWLSVAGLVVVALAIWACRKNDFDMVACVGLLVSPFVFSYNLLPLVALIRRRSFLIGFTLISWFTFALSAWWLTDGPGALLAVGALGALVWNKRREAG
jgi:hypothetical protein